MYFVERAGGNLFKSFDTVDSDKSRIKTRHNNSDPNNRKYKEEYE
jgi:hypothetical protein